MNEKQISKIPFGMRDGSLLHISQVERGLKCNCICPACNEPLVARKGKKTVHHFAHYRINNCSPETALHQIGKRLIFERISNAFNGGLLIKMTWKCSKA